jgi:hypothetical protein
MPGNLSIRKIVTGWYYETKCEYHWPTHGAFLCWGALERAPGTEDVRFHFRSEILLWARPNEAGLQAKCSFRQFCSLSMERQSTMEACSDLMKHRSTGISPRLWPRSYTNSFSSAFSILNTLLKKRAASAWTSSSGGVQWKFSALFWHIDRAKR